MKTEDKIKSRLEEIRLSIESEDISYEEIAYLQSHAEFIDKNDVVLLEWAGVEEQSDDIIVSFHIGRGGRFYNSGHKTYLGEKTFQDLIQDECNFLYLIDKDSSGNHIQPYFQDDSGNQVSDDNVNGLVGTLAFDGDYDTSIAKNIISCTDSELDLIRASDMYKSQELLDYLESVE